MLKYLVQREHSLKTHKRKRKRKKWNLEPEWWCRTSKQADNRLKEFRDARFWLSINESALEKEILVNL
jgi:hypothetical protein